MTGLVDTMTMTSMSRISIWSYLYIQVASISVWDKERVGLPCTGKQYQHEVDMVREKRVVNQ